VRYCLLIIMLLQVAFPAAAMVVDRDTTWQGELSFAEDVRVLPDVTLTVAAGSKVSFSNGGLEVVGTLIATDAEFSGQTWDGLLLKGSDSKTVLFRCVVRGAKTGIAIKGGMPTLEKLELIDNEIGVEVRGKAGGKLVSSSFVGNEKVGLFIKDDSTTSVSGCRFDKNGRYGAYIYRSNPQMFTANSFSNNEVGLMIAYHGSNPLIDNNDFEQNTVAIQVDRTAKPEIKENRLINNQTGLYAYRRSDPVVAGNRFAKNDIGVLVAYSSYPHVEGNDFIDNQLAMKLEYQSSEWEMQRGAEARASETAARTAFAGQGMRTVSEEDRKARNLAGVVEAGGNWWGVEGSAELATIGTAGNPSFIHDGRDQATFEDAGNVYPLDRVAFSPWSRTPLTEAGQ